MNATCPVVGKPGKPVQEITIRSLVSEARLPEVEGHQWFFCAEPDCEVVYFTGDGKTIPKRDLNVHVGIKEKDGPHLVCYCFDHSEENIRKEIEETGKSTVLESITAKVKNGECRCETINPKGTCCLGDISKAVKQAFANVGHPTEPKTLSSENTSTVHECCSDNESSEVLERQNGKGSAGIWAAVGSIGTAIVASACCWLPLLLLAFGVSAAGVSAAFETVRPVFLGLTAILLAAGFYLTYFRREKCAPATECRLPNPKLKRFNRAMLWIATIVVVAVAFFPNYLGFVAGGKSSPAPSSAGEKQTITLLVEGMTCEECAIHLKSDLEAVPGVESVSVNYEEGRAVVILRPDSDRPRTETLIDAVENFGYKARPQDGPKGK